MLPALTAVTSCWQLNLNFISTLILLKYLIPSARVNLQHGRESVVNSQLLTWVYYDRTWVQLNWIRGTVRARCCKYFTCFTPTEYRDTTTFDINREVGIFWICNKFIHKKKNSKRESFLTKNYSGQLSGKEVFFSCNFFLMQFFPLGHLSGACLFIQKTTEYVFSQAIHFSGAVIWCLSLHKWPKGQETPFLSYYSVLS